MLTWQPPGLPPNAPLVVVLHGCGQTAAGIATGAGWLELADRHGFALLLPEQRRVNNPNTCFNWFSPADNRRDTGEAASIAAMIRHMIAAQAIDPARVFITGLSAGGAFANVMLATYPELFAAGAIIAGLPYNAAPTMHAALDLMRQGQARTDRAWGDLMRSAAPAPGRAPRIAVWHGLADTTVAPVNATAIIRQWLDVRGLNDTTMRRDKLGPANRQTWTDGTGAPALELVTIPGFGHAVPISANDPQDDLRCGTPAPYILESGLSSTALIARDWGLTRRFRPASARQPAPPPPPESPLAATLRKFTRFAFTKP